MSWWSKKEESEKEEKTEEEIKRENEEVRDSYGGSTKETSEKAKTVLDLLYDDYGISDEDEK